MKLETSRLKTMAVLLVRGLYEISAMVRLCGISNDSRTVTHRDQVSLTKPILLGLDCSREHICGFQSGLLKEQA